MLKLKRTLVANDRRLNIRTSKGFIARPLDVRSAVTYALPWDVFLMAAIPAGEESSSPYVMLERRQIER